MLREKIKQYDKKYGTGNFLTLNEGQNQVRILTEPELYDDVINGQAGGSFIAYVINRDPENGDSLALLNLSKVVIRWLGEQEELGKFSGYPMPHDVMIFKQKSGGKSTYVSVAVDQGNSPSITSEQQALLAKAKPIAEVAAALAKKKASNLITAPHSVAALPPDSTQAKRNASEMNHMFTALTKAIETAPDEAKLQSAIEMILVCKTNSTINDFEVDLLHAQVVTKKAELTGTAAEDISVEDIPF